MVRVGKVGIVFFIQKRNVTCSYSEKVALRVKEKLKESLKDIKKNLLTYQTKMNKSFPGVFLIKKNWNKYIKIQDLSEIFNNGDLWAKDQHIPTNITHFRWLQRGSEADVPTKHQQTCIKRCPRHSFGLVKASQVLSSNKCRSERVWGTSLSSWTQWQPGVSSHGAAVGFGWGAVTHGFSID